jgi:hypothetical protein
VALGDEQLKLLRHFTEDDFSSFCQSFPDNSNRVTEIDMRDFWKGEKIKKLKMPAGMKI